MARMPQQKLSSSLSLSAITVAILDIIMDSVAISMGVWYIIFILQDEAYEGVTAKLSFAIMYLLYMTGELIVAILLLIGVTRRHPAYCELWLLVCLLNLLIKGVQFVYSVGIDKGRLNDVGASAVEPLIRVAMFFVVYTFTKRLKLVLRPRNISVYYLLREDV